MRHQPGHLTASTSTSKIRVAPPGILGGVGLGGPLPGGFLPGQPELTTEINKLKEQNDQLRKELDERGEWDICAGPGADHVYDRSARRGQHRSRIRGKPGLPYAGRSRDDDSGAWVALKR